MTTLIFVRHGATDWTAQRRLQGRTDIDLSPEGRAQTARLASAVSAWQPKTLLVSPLSRTRSTAALVSDLTPVTDARWVEAGLGEWEGRVPDEIGSNYAAWRGGAFTPPGGETATEVAARIETAVLDAAAMPGPVVIVTHGGTIRAVLSRFVGLTTARLFPVAAPSMTVLDVDEAGDAQLRHYNLLVA